MRYAPVLPLQGKNIILAICGSVAAPKAFFVLRQLQALGADIEVLMSEHAEQFLGPWAIKGVTGKMPYRVMFDPPVHIQGEPHITLSKWADVMLVLPATDSFIANFAHGIPNSVPGLVAKNMAPESILIAPAMSDKMWRNPATQENVSKLIDWGVECIGPVEGLLASGDSGFGRMVEAETAVSALRKHCGSRFGDLCGVSIVISAGGLRERIDGVRYLTNASSGRQGYALAEAARDRGASVTLLTASSLRVPEGLDRVISIQSHADLKQALTESIPAAAVYIGAAAVSDYTYPDAADSKIKRKAGESITLKFQPTEDLIQSITKEGLLKVAFAAETDNHLEYARKKRTEKNAELIVLNDVANPDIGFQSESNRVTIISKSGEVSIPGEGEGTLDKYSISWYILDEVSGLLNR